MKGIDDPTLGARRLSQDTLSNQELTSSVYAAIYEGDRKELYLVKIQQVVQ